MSKFIFFFNLFIAKASPIIIDFFLFIVPIFKGVLLQFNFTIGIKIVFAGGWLIVFIIRLVIMLDKLTEQKTRSQIEEIRKQVELEELNYFRMLIKQEEQKNNADSAELLENPLQ